MSRLFVVSAAVLAPGCEPPEKAGLEVVVSPVRAPCVGLGPMMCLVYREDGGDPEVTHDSFDGWTHRWGVETRLRYHVEAIEDPPRPVGPTHRGRTRCAFVGRGSASRGTPFAGSAVAFPGARQWRVCRFDENSDLASDSSSECEEARTYG